MSTKPVEMMPAGANLSYVTLISLFASARAGTPRIRRIRRIRGSDPGSYPLLVECTDGEIYTYASHRAFRYRHGLSRLEKEIFNKYFPDQFFSGDQWNETWFIDVGANVGEFALAALHRGGRVLAIEPDPTAFECLKLNAGDVSSGSLRLEAAACAPTSGEARLFLKSDTADSSLWPSPDVHSEDDVMPVVAVTLADLIASRPPDAKRIYVKVETEGFEPEVLMGLKGAEEHVDAISVDVSAERSGQSPSQQVIEILKQFNFSVDWIIYEKVLLGRRQRGHEASTRGVVPRNA